MTRAAQEIIAREIVDLTLPWWEVEDGLRGATDWREAREALRWRLDRMPREVLEPVLEELRRQDR